MRKTSSDSNDFFDSLMEVQERLEMISLRNNSTGDVAIYKEKINSLEKELRKLKESNSWKMTAPLRRAANYIRWRFK